MPAFPVVDVDEWEVVDFEPMGSKPGKLWLQPPAGSPFEERRWLFKPTTIQREHDREFLKGDDWAEKLVAEVAHLLWRIRGTRRAGHSAWLTGNHLRRHLGTARAGLRQ
jgi:hypothetical protein